MGRCYRNRQKCRKGSTASNLSDTVVELIKWFRETCESAKKLGSGLRLSDFPTTGRGLMTLNPIATNSVLISIPIRFMVTRNRAVDVLKEVVQSDLPTHHLLSLFLLHESSKGFASYWYPYLQTIPTSYDVPYFCSSDELTTLPSSLLLKCQAQQKLVTDAFNLVKTKIVCENFYLTLDKFSWAWFSVNTRAVHFNDNNLDTSQQMALAPYLDMFNHSTHVQVKAGIFQSNEYREGVYRIISLNQSYKKYDQVFINYGSHDNLKLCFEYGFVLDNNPNDSVPFELVELTRHHPNSTKAEDFIRLQKLDKNLGIVATDLKVTWNVLACLYIIINLSKPETWKKVYSIDLESWAVDNIEIRRILHSIIRSKLADADVSLSGNPVNCSNSYKILRNLLEMHRKLLLEADEGLLNC